MDNNTMRDCKAKASLPRQQKQKQNASSKRLRGGRCSEVPPPFPFFGRPSSQLAQVVSTETGALLGFAVKARVDQGITFCEDWTCYRRNYISIACCFDAFTASGPPISTLAPRSTGLKVSNGAILPINRYLLCLSAHPEGNLLDEVKLIQNTAKRDKGPKDQPRPHPCLPGGKLSDQGPVSSTLQNIVSSNTSSTIAPKSGPESDNAALTTMPDPVTPKLIVFDRLLFRASTVFPSPPKPGSYNVLKIDLLAEIVEPNGDDRLIPVARLLSNRLVVRGKSPSHYDSSLPYSEQPASYPSSFKKEKNRPLALAIPADNRKLIDANTKSDTQSDSSPFTCKRESVETSIEPADSTSAGKPIYYD
ncbi:hypothetical protein HDU67_007542 [Dinochytrium kinnereticum]|nr:hypothetical protein HDU67_007542 [Dinochytrium kinnereticum]